MMLRAGTLLRDVRGSMAIETAFVVPILATMCFGGFEASQIVARQSELQGSVAEALAIVQASPPETAEDRATIEEVIEASTGLDKSLVSLEVVYRCGSETKYEVNDTICLGSDDTDDDDDDDGGYTVEEVSTFIKITIKDSHKPAWVDFGIGKPINYNVTRTVQVS